MALAREVDLVRPACEERDRGEPATAARHDPPAVGELLAVEVAPQAAAGLLAMRLCVGGLTLEDRRDRRVRVDLAVGVVERDPDRFAAVLERVHVRDLVPCAEDQRPVRPDRDQPTHVTNGHRAELPRVLGGIDDDLAGTVRRLDRRQVGAFDGRFLRVGPQRREAVVEDRDLEVGAGDLGRRPARFRGTERAIVGSGQECPVLAMRRGDDPLAEDRVPAALRHRLRWGRRRVAVRRQASGNR